MFASHFGFRSLLARWFGSRNGVRSAKSRLVAGRQANQASGQEPLFSLGDAKQDVVVSFRGAETEES